MEENKDNTQVEQAPVPETADAVVETSTNNKSVLIVGVSMIVTAIILAAAYVYVEMSKLSEQVVIENVPEIQEEEVISPTEWTFEGEGDEVEGADKEVGDDAYSHTLSPDNSDYSTYYQNTIKQPGVEFFMTPIARGDLGLFTLAGQVAENLKDIKYQYYEIGWLDSGSLYLVHVPCFDMMCSDSALFFIGTPEREYRLLTKYSDYDALSESYYGIQLRGDVVIDTNMSIAAYDLPKSLTVDGVTLDMRWGQGWTETKDFFANSAFNSKSVEDSLDYKTIFIADTAYGPLFRGFRVLWDGLTADVDYAVRLPGGLVASLDHSQDFITDDRVPQFTRLDGTKNTEPYRTDGLSGCGSGGPEVMMEIISENDLAVVGYTEKGKEIYNVTNSNHPIITRLFEEGDMRSYWEYDTVSGDSVEKTITKAEFVRKGGVLIYEDEFGLQHVMTNTKYGPQAECGKPVIYVYPETETTVSVKVDAKITKSEPVYANGWTALAKPNGNLVVDGKTYDSLYWDGYGNGEYPVFDDGFVVETHKALDVMSQHLRTMGFNEKEIGDFVTFWQPHLPEEPYTRFSWIGTSGMEQLAKLDIEPKPDSLIRAFVDYEGLTEPVTLAPQRIPTYSRTGYVVTEWGGLLRN